MSEPRRIYTRIVIDMTQDDLPIIESESYLYDGPMDLCMPSDGGGGRSGGDGDRGSGGSSDSGRGSDGRNGGSSGRDSGGSRSFGSADAAYSRNEAVAREAANRENSFGFAGITGLNGPQHAIDSHAMSPGKSDTGYYGNDPDMTDQITGLTGKQVSRTAQGYVADDGTRMAYSSGNPTAHGAAAAGREADVMSWQGGSMMSKAAQDSRVSAKNTRAREIQDRVTKALKDPVAMGLDPHQALAAYNDVMHGMYDKAVAVGAMSPAEAREVQESFGGVGAAFGFGLDDVTTPYESFVGAVDQGLVDPTTGKLTAKGWANVAAPALGMLAGPLSMLGFSAFGLPGAVVGALAPSAVNAMTATKKSTGIDTATGLASQVTGVDMSPVAAGLSYADTMNTMGKAQQHAGTAPGRPDSIESFGGSESGDSFLKGFEQFFTKKAAPATSPQGTGVNPKFQQRWDNRFADRSQQGQQPGSTTKPSVSGMDFMVDYQQFFTRRV